MPALAASDEEPTPGASARKEVRDATAVVKRMKHDPRLARLLAKSKAVFLVPHYGRGGIIIGGAGGTGMLLVHRKGGWSPPAFYSVGGFNIGIQLGAAGGPVAMLLMNDKSIKMFEDHPSKWSMSTAAGVTFVKYGGETEGSTSYSDVVLWTGLQGLYGGVSIGASDVIFNADVNRGYYHRKLTARQIIGGSSSEAQPLLAALGSTPTVAAAATKAKTAKK